MWPGAVPPPMAPVTAAAPRRDPKLVAAGVLSLLTGALLGAFGAWLVWVTRDATDSVDDFIDFDGLFRALGVFLMFVAALYLLTGIGCALGRQWGRITAIVFNVLIGAVGLLGAMGDGDRIFAIVMIVWSGAIVVLAVTGRPTRRT